MSQANDSITAHFGGTFLGDARRAERFRMMLRQVASRPAGAVSDVFLEADEQQGAYDFLENELISAGDVQAAASKAMAKLCGGHDSVLLVLDGSSFSLTDHTGKKGFGSVGTRSQGALGLKVLNALALTSAGQTIGVVAQQYWVRGKRVARGYRPLEKRESYRWHEAYDSARAALSEHAPKTRLHVLADREADAALLMQHIASNGDDFTIRSRGVRKALVDGQRVMVRPLLLKLPPIARHAVTVREPGMPERIARLEVRAAPVQLVLRDHHHKNRRTLLPVTVVWGREVNAPSGAEPVDWMLYTTAPVKTAADAVAALERYAKRWRIEDFHRALKSGGGCVEDSQLRSSSAVIKWATLHAIVASRAQRLRDASRITPDAPASTELSEEEIQALVLMKTHEKRRTETVSAEGLTLGRAVRWIGDLGGFSATGVSKKMPGTKIIERGLERVLGAAEVIRALRASGKIR
jgi:hypothetical protein